MNITELEALDKICPFMTTVDSDVKCQGGDCMLWIWRKTHLIIPGNLTKKERKDFCGKCSLIAIAPPTEE